MGSSKAPKTPDYTGAAREQAKSDREIAEYLTNANRINQIDPYGQTTFTQTSDQTIQDQINALLASGAQDPTRPGFNQKASTAAAQKMAELGKQLEASRRWTQTTTLSPAQQKLLEQQQGIQGQQNTRISDLLSQFETPTLKSVSQNDIQDLLYGKITKQYGDRFAREEQSQRAQLANQGFQMGSEGYQNTLADFTREKNSAYEDAATQAALASYDQMNAERGLNLNEYNTQMGYLSQLLGGGQPQGPTMPQYQPFAQATPFEGPDLLGALSGQYQGNLNRTNAQTAGRGQTIGAVGALASAAAVAY